MIQRVQSIYLFIIVLLSTLFLSSPLLSFEDAANNIYSIRFAALQKIGPEGGVEFIDSTIIYEFINDGFNKIYSSLESKGTQADIALINNDLYGGEEVIKDISLNFTDDMKLTVKVYINRVLDIKEQDSLKINISNIFNVSSDNVNITF